MSEPISVSASASIGAGSIFKGIKFIIVSYVVSLALIALLSALIVYTSLPEAVCAPAVRIITFFGAFLSALLTTRSAGSRGWLLGAASGAANIMILILLGMALMGGRMISASNLLMILFGAVAGMAGGIVGVNTQRR